MSVITYAQLKNIARILGTTDFMILDGDNDNQLVIDTTKGLNSRIIKDNEAVRNREHQKIVNRKFHKPQKAFLIKKFDRGNARASIDALSESERRDISKKINPNGRIIVKSVHLVKKSQNPIT